MKDTLIVGCSFIERLQVSDDPNIDIFGSCASGNASIAARVIYQLSQHSYKKVVILWSGINRLDLSMDIELHTLYQLIPNPYKFYNIQDSVVWYHSGGLFRTGTHFLKDFPDLVKKYFSDQYKTASSRFLTTLTLLNILSVQVVLETKNIEYHMDFIYDIHKDYSETNFGYSLGQIDTTSPLYNLVDWNKLNQTESMYEWTVRNNYLDFDKFHPTFNGSRVWAKDCYNIYV